MKKQDILSKIYYLREKSELNKLVVFVGAGVSCNVDSMPSWNELIVEMANSIGYSKCNFCKHKKDCKNRCKNCAIKDECLQKCFTVNDFSSDDLLRIPQFVYNKSSKKYNDILISNISDKEIDVPLSKAIFEINPAHIITTNYDKLLESSSSEFRNQYDVVISDKDLLDAEKSKYIIKMHGDVSHPETIVLKEQDYLNYSQNHILIELFVKALLADHTILFLGYSLNDYNIKLIISWINYLRSKNGLLSNGKKIGYIILDEDKVNKETISYFENNSIEVLNIRSLPQIKNIPAELSDDRGKRLYSFLKILKDPSLEEGISSKMSIDNIVDFLGTHKIYDYRILLKLLNVERYNKEGSVLEFNNKDQYLRFESYFKTNSDKAKLLQQMFVNVGITTIQYSSSRDISLKQSFSKDMFFTLSYSIDENITSNLFGDDFYDLYIQNKYSDLLELCNGYTCDKIKSCFYKHFTTGYVGLNDVYKTIDFEELDTDNKVSFLHDNAVINHMDSFLLGFDSDRVQQYINNIPSARERQLFEEYLNLYNGSTSKRLSMISSLEKLKHNIASIPSTFFSGGAVSEIYNIRNIAITEYMFYYTNNIFTLGFSDLSTFFRPYIEAIICANREDVERSSNVIGFESVNEKYFVSALDFDIISKYISAQDLIQLIDENKIVQIRTEKSIVSHLVACFINLVASIVTKQTYGHKNSSISLLANLALLLTKIDLSEDDKAKLSVAINTLFTDSEFNKRFWFIGGPSSRECVKSFFRLIEILPTNKTNIICIKSIISSPGFFEFSFNSNVYLIRSILLYFLDENNKNQYQTDLKDIINSELDFNNKVMLLRLFYKRIVNKATRKEYKSFLSDNFMKIGTYAIYDFAFNGWIKISDNEVNELKNKTLELFKSKEKGAEIYPDPVKTNLECLYLLHITGLANDLSSLEEMSQDYLHLQFLLNPESFDYTQVDFSNYMWQNFARRPKYMKLFVEHKSNIIPLIEEKIKKDYATEFEKRIFYKFFLSKSEVLNF